MGLARFEIISGLLDTILILMGVVLMVQFRIIRKTLKRQRLHNSVEEPFYPSGVPSFRSQPLRDPGEGSFFDSSTFKEDRDRERKRLDAAIRDAEQVRSELSVLFFDVQRFLDDLTPIVRPFSGVRIPVSEPPPSSAPPPDNPQETRAANPPESMKERVSRLAREGRTVSEIAAEVGRGEGEVAFLLSMEKVGSA